METHFMIFVSIGNLVSSCTWIPLCRVRERADLAAPTERKTPVRFRLRRRPGSCERSSWRLQRFELEEFPQALSPRLSVLLDRYRCYKPARSLSDPTC